MSRTKKNNTKNNNTKKNKTRKIWIDIIAILILGVWAYFADYVIVGMTMESVDYPLIGEAIAGVVSVNKVVVFLIGIFFYLITSSFAMSRFIGWLGSMIVMTEIMLMEPLKKLMQLVHDIEDIKAAGEAMGAEVGTDIGTGIGTALGIDAGTELGGELTAANQDAQMALERYGVFPWKSDMTWVKWLAYIGALLMAILLVYTIVVVVKDRKAKNTTRKAVRNMLIFIAILAVLIFVPGIIMGTGPQWLFLAFMTLLAWVSYMYGTIKRSNKEIPVVAAAITIVLMIVLSCLDMCYRAGSAGIPI